MPRLRGSSILAEPSKVLIYSFLSTGTSTIWNFCSFLSFLSGVLDIYHSEHFMGFRYPLKDEGVQRCIEFRKNQG